MEDFQSKFHLAQKDAKY